MAKKNTGKYIVKQTLSINLAAKVVGEHDELDDANRDMLERFSAVVTTCEFCEITVLTPDGIQVGICQYERVR